jgi:hypothetical protein
MSGDGFFHHRPEAVWTVGQLRDALAQFDPDLPIRLECDEEPGSEFVDTERVLTGAATMPVYDEKGQPTEMIAAVVLAADFTEGDYTLPKFPTSKLRRTHAGYYDDPYRT